MTTRADHVSLPLEDTDIDQRPGSSDVSWAERAYKHEERQPASERRSRHRPSRRQLRVLLAALVLFVTVGLVVIMRYQGAAPAPIAHRPTPSQTVATPRPTITRSPFTLTQPIGSPFPSLSPTINVLKR
jgi:hypothetical protein